VERTDHEVVAFCERMRPQLLGTLTLYCGDRELAAELTQETLARCWESWHTLRNPGAASRQAWAHRIAMNLATSWFRRRAAERRAHARLGPAGPPDGGDVAAAVAVRTAVGRLPPRQRQALVLRYFADLPVSETAEVMGCASGTVKALTSQALDALRGVFDLKEV
jgi:RNA polymerase sigma-70 factor (sigma-E family)